MTHAFITLLYVTLLFAALAVGWLLTLVSLPGNWLIVGAAALYAWATPDGTRWDLSWQLVGVLAVLAVVGEVIEAVASAAGVRKHGGSRRGALLSIVGSLVGAIVGTGAVPIPVVGTLLGACVGAMLGAVLGETWKGTDPDAIDRIGRAAFWGRLLGSLGKLLVACVLVATVAAGVVWH